MRPGVASPNLPWVTHAPSLHATKKTKHNLISSRKVAADANGRRLCLETAPSPLHGCYTILACTLALPQLHNCISRKLAYQLGLMIIITRRFLSKFSEYQEYFSTVGTSRSVGAKVLNFKSAKSPAAATETVTGETWRRCCSSTARRREVTGVCRSRVIRVPGPPCAVGSRMSQGQSTKPGTRQL